MTDPNLAARAEALASTIAIQSEAVQRLSDSVRQLAASQDRIRKVQIATVLGLILDLSLTLVAALLFNNQRAVSDRLTDANRRIEQVQSRTSNEVLCPLYKTFIAFESRAKDSPLFTPEERAQRIRAYEVIHQGYDALGCQ